METADHDRLGPTLEGHRFYVIALSLILVRACGPTRSVTLDGAVVDGSGLDHSFPVMSWAISAGGTSGDDGTSFAVDGSGNSYVTGFFHGPASLAARRPLAPRP